MIALHKASSFGIYNTSQETKTQLRIRAVQSPEFYREGPMSLPREENEQRFAELLRGRGVADILVRNNYLLGLPEPEQVHLGLGEQVQVEQRDERKADPDALKLIRTLGKVQLPAASRVVEKCPKIPNFVDALIRDNIVGLELDPFALSACDLRVLFANETTAYAIRIYNVTEDNVEIGGLTMLFIPGTLP
ncbi:MAG: hypothetical protein JWN48_4245, partial [Myxococcaceae bacterium]|nr:hypothetical protein [Myxococcaceae bacterium]